MKKVGKDWYIITDKDDLIVGIKRREGMTEIGAKEKMRKILAQNIQIEEEIFRREVPKAVFKEGAKGTTSILEGRWKVL